jgi:1-deoxy-D-xylulose-5-phosphate reductoisomerase
MIRRISILGATGSVGGSTIDVIAQARAAGAEIDVVSLTANTDVEGLARAARATRCRHAVIADPGRLGDLRDALSGTRCEAAAGPQAVVEAAAREADWTMSAIVGAAGVAPTLAAVRRGGTLALANKESLVCGGTFMIDEARRAGTTILPVDSEHNAVFQVLTHPAHVARVTLTASGGPFRTWEHQRIAAAPASEALRHPTWTMGRKITIDSATLMNKGLELIEAALLFSLSDADLDVVVHPQSIVHALVTYCDGATLAQLSAPDMRIPIASALAHPGRIALQTSPLDLVSAGSLTFEAPDLKRFPALGLARASLREGGALPAVLNAANEVAVEAYLDDRIGFYDLSALCEATLEAASRASFAPPRCVEDMLEIDRWARAHAVGYEKELH